MLFSHPYYSFTKISSFFSSDINFPKAKRYLRPIIGYLNIAPAPEFWMFPMSFGNRYEASELKAFRLAGCPLGPIVTDIETLRLNFLDLSIGTWIFDVPHVIL